MKYACALALTVGLLAAALWSGQASAQAAPQGACIPGPPGPPNPNSPPAPPARNVTVSAIPGVVAAGVPWTQVWYTNGNNADGIIPDRDGSLLVAQKDNDTVLRIRADGSTEVAVPRALGIGSLQMDSAGKLYGVHRAELPTSTKPHAASVINEVSILAPARGSVATKWVGGAPLTLRPNDLAFDAQGGAYFTGTCVYYGDAAGARVASEVTGTNGIAMAADGKTLYVTSGNSVVAYDVAGPGRLASQREFAKLPDNARGDGLAIDAEGRLYVSSFRPGVNVYAPNGSHLGTIPTPRDAISVAFAGPDRRTMYIVGTGATGANGQPLQGGPQRTSATIYSLPMLAQGRADRAK